MFLPSLIPWKPSEEPKQAFLLSKPWVNHSLAHLKIEDVLVIPCPFWAVPTTTGQMSSERNYMKDRVPLVVDTIVEQFTLKQHLRLSLQ